MYCVWQSLSKRLILFHKLFWAYFHKRLEQAYEIFQKQLMREQTRVFHSSNPRYSFFLFFFFSFLIFLFSRAPSHNSTSAPYLLSSLNMRRSSTSVSVPSSVRNLRPQSVVPFSHGSHILIELNHVPRLPPPFTFSLSLFFHLLTIF